MIAFLGGEHLSSAQPLLSWYKTRPTYNQAFSVSALSKTARRPWLRIWSCARKPCQPFWVGSSMLPLRLRVSDADGILLQLPLLVPLLLSPTHLELAAPVHSWIRHRLSHLERSRFRCVHHVHRCHALLADDSCTVCIPLSLGTRIDRSGQRLCLCPPRCHRVHRDIQSVLHLGV